MQILHVTPITRSITTEVLTYFSAKPVQPGTLVTVPLRKQEIKALVINAVPVTNLKIQLRGADYQIRNIIAIHDEQIFSAPYLQTCNAVKNFYATNTGKLINLISPSYVVKNIEQFNRPKNSIYSNYSLKLFQRNYTDRIIYYKTLIREKMLHKESLHIICPTQQEAIALYSELVKNNESSVVLLHSKITKKNLGIIFNTLKESKNTTCVISTPGFIDTYQYNKSLLIIENESSEYYRTVAQPRIDMRVFIMEYAKKSNLECIISASILRPESWYLSTIGAADIIEPFNKKVIKNSELSIENLHQRKPGKQDDLERLEELRGSKGFQSLSKESLKKIQKAVDEKKSIFIFSHKKSLAPSIICRHCGNMARSSESGFPYSLYIKQNQQTKIKERIYVCKNTGEKIPAFDICQFCKGHHLIPFGIGTETLSEEIKNHFPKVAQYIIDANNNTTQKKLKEISNEYQSSESASIVIGTQKALPYISNTDLCIISSLDSYFARMSYSMNTQCISLVKELSEKTKGELVIQSRNIIESILPILEHGIYSEYVEQDLQERKDFFFPPYATLITIKKQIKKEYLKNQYHGMNRLFDEYNPQILIQPGNKKGMVELITIVQLDTKEWNIDNQNEKLLSILLSLDRSTYIYVNPKDLI